MAQTQEGVTLQSAIRALKKLGIEVALDLGEHGYCKLDSNCPVAIKVREVITKAEVDPFKFGEALEKVLTGIDFPVRSTLINPSLQAEFRLFLPGVRDPIVISCQDALNKEILVELKREVASLESQRESLLYYGQRLQDSYRLAMLEMRYRVGEDLRQLPFSMFELIDADAFTSVDKENNCYLVLFRTKYHPEYLVEEDRRYKISSEDAERLVRDILLGMKISQEHKFIGFILFKPNGRKFQHYHGNAYYDCWGNVKFPEEWDGTINQLIAIKKMLEGSLVTINLSSLMNDRVENFISTRDLKDRATLLGREGFLNNPQPQGNTLTTEGAEVQTRAWGWGRRTNG